MIVKSFFLSLKISKEGKPTSSTSDVFLGHASHSWGGGRIEGTPRREPGGSPVSHSASSVTAGESLSLSFNFLIYKPYPQRPVPFWEGVTWVRTSKGVLGVGHSLQGQPEVRIWVADQRGAESSSSPSCPLRPHVTQAARCRRSGACQPSSWPACDLMGPSTTSCCDWGPHHLLHPHHPSPVTTKPFASSLLVPLVVS